MTFLIMGGVALLFDRVLLSQGPAGDRSLPPAPIGKQTPQAPAADSAPPDPPSLSIPELPFPHGLKPKAADAFEGPMRDLFAPPGSQGRSGGDGPNSNRPASGSHPREPRLTSAEFRSTYRANGVLLLQRLRIAIINGMWVRTGQSVDGCVLKSVSDNNVRFECYDGDAVLRVTASQRG